MEEGHHGEPRDGGKDEEGPAQVTFLVENDVSSACFSVSLLKATLSSPTRLALISILNLWLSSEVLLLCCLVSFPVKFPFLWSKVAL